MTDGPPEDENREDESISTLVARLIDDVERFVRAEIRLYRAQLFDRVKSARMAIILGATGMLLAQSATIALLVGLVVILIKPVGPIWATIIVVTLSFAIAAVLFRIALTKLKDVTRIKEDRE